MATAEQLGIDNVQEILTGLYGLEGKIKGREFRIFCPVHERDAGHRPSCDVNLHTGLYNCFSCPASGDIIGLGCLLLGKSRRHIKQYLQLNEPDAVAASIQRRLRVARTAFNQETEEPPTTHVLIPPTSAYEPCPAELLSHRGFTEETLRRWDIRFVKKATLMKDDGKDFAVDNAIAIPIFGADGALLGYCYRATDKSARWFQKVRYIYTPGLRQTLSHTWYGLHMHRNEPEITVAEGALDAIWCDQNGVPAVAILGSQIKQNVKLRALMDFRKVTIFTDRDLSGSTTAYFLGVSLQERGIPVTIVTWPEWVTGRDGNRAKDPQDLCKLDLELLHTRAMPFLAWKRSRFIIPKEGILAASS